MEQPLVSDAPQSAMQIDTPVWLPLHGEDLRKRVSLWRGTTLATPSQVEHGYSPDALLPNFGASWLPAVRPIVTIVSTPSQWVTVARVSDEVLERGRAAARDRVTDRDDLLGSYAELLVSSVERSVSGASELQPLGFAKRDGGRLTTTWDRVRERYIGLHVDSWDRSPMRHRGDARNRICVNLGEGPRSFVFLPTSIMALAPLTGCDPETANPSDIGRVFLGRCRSVILIEVVTMPGEAYVAPTETLIHDGSTRFSENADLTFTVLGRFVARA